MPPQASSSSNPATTSVQVALRIRPTTTHDTNSIPSRFQRSVISAVNNTTVSVDATPPGANAAPGATASSSTGKKQQFTFDQVHSPSTTQHTLFTSTARPLLDRFVEGFNCTILAYGQTSSGKTFTMTGVDLDADPSDPVNGMGIIPRAVSTIFHRCRELKEERGNAWQYTLKGSFIEIYNEDLIDLLNSEDGGGKREVQIREDKQGHIIWEGLREVTVKGSGEVMNLLRQGTSIRRTNETDMNAQSSRSHAIFSLTLIQKKYSGSGQPPRSSSPLPPGRPPSRIARPGSTLVSSSARVSSPTFGRPSTPSFHTAMARGGRPSSSLGMLSPDGRQKNADGDDEQGEWVTVVSKFHFVDLAGSERLKRTAAAGERIKEGISINSGLLALGNVISALGDPARAKSHTASYIPYRDSKLTRLLQDSLGGNAHTLMIACVSPTEWNLGETINTLKYANRARNIKNRVVMNEKEEGWDDVEWLQGVVTRLRKEVKSLKEGNPGAITVGAGMPVEIEGAGKKVLAQMAELQNNYEDLRGKFVERTEELTRLRRELAEKQRNSKGGNVAGTARYEEIVGPVIEEYEKTISAMEAELSLNRAALRHTNDMYEEQEAELTELQQRHSTTEAYLEELKARVVKLSEREQSNEAYIRDLEEKVKQYDDTSVTSSGSITDLRREITRYKDSESSSTQYIAELEQRLARADESVLTLRQRVEELEEDCERRRTEVEVLESRLESFKKDGESWRTDLEEREKTVRELEKKMAEWQAKMKQASDDRERLGNLASEVAKARQELEVPPASTLTPSPAASTISLPATENPLETQLLALQQTHTATLSDLAAVSDKYRDALREIADLAAQLEEAKVSSLAPPDEADELDLSPRRRMGRHPSDGTQTPINGSGKRLLYRHAASTESLHQRSLSQSLSLSQELSSARSRKASGSSHGSSSSLSLSSPRSMGHIRPNLSISVSPSSANGGERSVSSLETEIMRLQEVLKEREAEITVLEQSLRAKERSETTSESSSSPRTPAVQINGNNVPDADGSLLHLSPKTMDQFSHIRRSLDLHSANGHTQDTDETLERLNELMRSMAQKESSHRENVDTLSSELAQVRRQFDELTVLSRDQALNMSTELDALRKSHEQDLEKHGEGIKALEEMRQHQRELEDSLSQVQAHEETVKQELEQLKQRESELVQSLERAQAAHAAELEQLKSGHEEVLLAKAAEVDALLKEMRESHDAALKDLHETHDGALTDLRDQLAQSSAELDKAKQDHEAAFGQLKTEHEAELQRRNKEVEDLLEQTRKEHEAALSKADAEHDAAIKKQVEQDAAALTRTEEEYYEALTKLRLDHAQAIDKQTAETSTAMQRLRDEHARELRMAEIAREGSLAESESTRDFVLKNLQEEHAAAAADKEKQFADDIQKLKEEHAAAFNTKQEQHRVSIERLKAEHASKINEREAVHADNLEKLEAEHARKEKEHRTALERATAEHATVITKLQEESAQQVAQLTEELEGVKTKLGASSQDYQKLEAELHSVREQQAVILQEVERGHQDDVTRLKEEHQRALDEAKANLAAAEEQHRQALADAATGGEKQVEERVVALLASHAEELVTLRSEHAAALAEVSATLVAEQEQHREDLKTSREQSERALIEEKDRLAASLAEMQKLHEQERETMQKDHDLLVKELSVKSAEEFGALSKEHALVLEELESHRAASNEFAALREDMRSSHEKALQQKSAAVEDLQQQLGTVQDERDTFAGELAKLRKELTDTKAATSALASAASKRDSLADELERHRAALAETQENLQRTKDEMDTLQAEKTRQDHLLRDMQSQLVRSPVPTAAAERFARANGASPSKLPPPTPPPSGPIPPAPRGMHEPSASTSSAGLTIQTSASGDSAEPSTPATSGPPTPTSTAPALAQQARQLEEQDAMIKTLNKQLSHCESDLQAHMDLVARLESSLGDSEKNLRKARMQATELARERDTLGSQVASLRAELQDAKSEVANVRRSVVEEKQSLEHRLDEERRAKERARAQLDSRMDELQRRKSKFACL